MNESCVAPGRGAQARGRAISISEGPERGRGHSRGKGGRKAAWLTPPAVSGDWLFSEPETLNPDPPDLAQVAVALLRGPPPPPQGGCGHERQPWAVGMMLFVVVYSEGFSCPRLLRGAIPRSPSRPLPTAEFPTRLCLLPRAPPPPLSGPMPAHPSDQAQGPLPAQASLTLRREAWLPPLEPTAVHTSLLVALAVLGLPVNDLAVESSAWHPELSLTPSRCSCPHAMRSGPSP